LKRPGRGVFYEQKIVVKFEFQKKMQECRGEAFQDFFHDLMTHRFGHDYVDIRPNGKFGDRGADGIRLGTRELFACYSPQAIDVREAKRKLKSDLESAIRQRPGQFDTFVFVCNDRWGTHPDISIMLAEEQGAIPTLSFGSMGTRKLWNEVMQLEIDQCEDLFGSINVEEVVDGIGMADLEPLLEHLIDNRRAIGDGYQVDIPNTRKMKYNKISLEYQEELTRGMRGTPLVDGFIQGMNDSTLEDEMAEGFAHYYRQSRTARGNDADQVMEDLLSYVAGNRRPAVRQYMAAWTIVTFFFERCHIFDPAPDAWTPEPDEGTGT
jgi:hypothetical protein